MEYQTQDFTITINGREEIRTYDPETYGKETCADAFIAGHLTDWTEFNKKHLTKNQLIHLLAIMESRALGEDNFADSNKVADHLRTVMQKTEEKIEAAKEAK